MLRYLDENASPERNKADYYQLSKVFHPDTNESGEDARFKALHAEYLYLAGKRPYPYGSKPIKSSLKFPSGKYKDKPIKDCVDIFHLRTWLKNVSFTTPGLRQAIETRLKQLQDF